MTGCGTVARGITNWGSKERYCATIATGKISAGRHSYVGARRSVGAASVHGEAPRRGDFPICMYFPAVKLIRKIGSLSFALIWRMPTPVPAWASALEDCVIG
ncbi:MAG: hypothetical protein CM15mP68_1870 [Pseudomonadota bacterium]|nr:MAG: hypothetical protein CM15mP68_1870 [Pseudomonadota bacterium]